jgi:hypothetical protein
MAEIKTKKTKASVAKFISAVSEEGARKDSKTLLTVFKKATGLRPAMWGASIVGYGSYHYKSERSSQEGDWPLTGFSPRKQNLTLYFMPGFKGAQEDLLKRLGKAKTSGGCLYIKRLEDVDLSVLTTMIKTSVAEMKKRYPAD